MLWIKFMIGLKQRGQGYADLKVLTLSNFTDTHLLPALSARDKLEIAGIMKEQKDLLAQVVYRWSDAESDKPFSDVQGEFASFAKENQATAIEARDRLAVKWASDNSFTCIKTSHTFSSTRDLVTTTAQLGMIYGGVLGYLGIQGTGGHALGFGYQPVLGNDFSVVFFDPNSGEYLFRSPDDFATYSPSAAWLNRYINTHYSGLMKVMYVHFFI